MVSSVFGVCMSVPPDCSICRPRLLAVALAEANRPVEASLAWCLLPHDAGDVAVLPAVTPAFLCVGVGSHPPRLRCLRLSCQRHTVQPHICHTVPRWLMEQVGGPEAMLGLQAGRACQPRHRLQCAGRPSLCTAQVGGLPRLPALFSQAACGASFVGFRVADQERCSSADHRHAGGKRELGKRWAKGDTPGGRGCEYNTGRSGYVMYSHVGQRGPIVKRQVEEPAECTAGKPGLVSKDWTAGMGFGWVGWLVRPCAHGRQICRRQAERATAGQDQSNRVASGI